MLRLLHAADVHLGLTKFGGAYDASDDTAAVLYAFADEAIRHQVDVALIAGDLFHTRRPAPEHLYTAARAIRRMAGEDILVIISGGNHDGPSLIDGGAHTLAWLHAADLPNVLVFTQPIGVTLTTPSGKLFDLVTVPYPHKRRWDAELHDLPISERVVAASQRLAQQVDDLSARVPDVPMPRIFMGHLTVEGAMIGTEREMQMGWDAVLPKRCLEPFQYSALGHIHRRQRVAPKAWYSGSPSFISFSEEGDIKAFNLVEIDGDTTTVESIHTGARLIQTVSDDLEVESGAILRLHASHDASPFEINERLRTLRAAGAAYIDVVYDPPPQTERLSYDETFDVHRLLCEYLERRRLPQEPYLSVAQEVIESC